DNILESVKVFFVTTNGDETDPVKHTPELAGNELSVSVGDIAAGKAKAVIFQVKVSDVKSEIKNLVTAEALDNDKDGKKLTESDEDGGFESKDSPASVFGSKTSKNLTAEGRTENNDKNYVGDVIEYTIEIKNSSDADYKDVVISDELSEYVDFNAAVRLDGADLAADKYNYDETSRVLTINVGDIPAPAALGDTTTVTVTFLVRINEKAYGQTITNTANVADKTGELDVDLDDKGGFDVEDGVVAVSEKSSEPIDTNNDGLINPGDTIRYTVSFTNNGSAETVWKAATAQDILPQYVTFAAENGIDIGTDLAALTPLDANDYDILANPAGLFVRLGDIQGGETLYIVFDVTIDDNADVYGKTIENSIDVSHIDDPVKDNDPVIVTDKFAKPNGTKTSKWIDANNDGIVNPGDTITYTIMLTNEGENETIWKDIVVNDTLPEYTAFAAANGVKIGSSTASLTLLDAAKYTVSANRKVLTIPVSDLRGSEKIYLVFDVTIDDNEAVYGQKIVNAIKVDPIEAPIEDEKPVVVPKKITVTFDANGGTFSSAADRANPTRKVITGKAYSAFPELNARTDYRFDYWMNENNQEVKPGAIVTAAADHKLTAHWTYTGSGNNGGGGGFEGNNDIVEQIVDEKPPLALPPLTDEHIPFISGYPNGTVMPDASLTRAEAAMIFFRLIVSPEKNAPLSSQFSDVADAAWYAQAVNYLASLDMLVGYSDGSFAPDMPITRAEFATLASKFDDIVLGTNNVFTDVDETHWAIQYINSAAAKGWVGGYEDGTFRPDMNITRAEVVSLVNKMLDRGVVYENIPESIINYTDLDVSHWGYTDIVEASNAHDYERDTQGNEIWTLK
ncbi:MAG: S-layer homology domain-containing protein, partial [Clostridiales bacterium]|nr:S-layer homology domain-containing protein [Clostridiales bacterium]